MTGTSLLRAERGSSLRGERWPTGRLHIAGSERSAPLEPGETLLHAAVRGQIPFPHLCGVGECGACKCRLTRGAVRLRTDISRHVSAEELSSGVILACQSVAESDDIEVALTGIRRRRARGGAP